MKASAGFLNGCGMLRSVFRKTTGDKQRRNQRRHPHSKPHTLFPPPPFSSPHSPTHNLVSKHPAQSPYSQEYIHSWPHGALPWTQFSCSWVLVARAAGGACLFCMLKSWELWLRLMNCGKEGWCCFPCSSLNPGLSELGGAAKAMGKEVGIVNHLAPQPGSVSVEIRGKFS